jgi:hypothetical protein
LTKKKKKKIDFKQNYYEKQIQKTNPNFNLSDKFFNMELKRTKVPQNPAKG